MELSVPSVNVKLRSTSSSTPKKNRKKRSKQSAPKVPPGQPQVMSGGFVSHLISKSKQRNKPITNDSPLPDYSVGWLQRHLDPCGEYRTALDYGKIPDGTLPQSASGQFREVFTIRPPGANPVAVPLEGGMWSLLIMSTPLWRTPFVLIADMLRPEVGNEAASAAFLYLNSVENSIERYPAWHETGMDGVYVSLVSWKALSGALLPSELGVSPLISDFRITGDGFTVSHNTPSLINQGIAVVAQFNPNIEPRDIELPSENGVTNVSAAIQYVLYGDTAGADVTTQLPGVGSYPWKFITNIRPRPPIGGLINSGILGTAVYDFTTSDGDVLWATGDSIRLQWTRPAGGAETITVQRSPDGTTWSNTSLARSGGGITVLVGTVGEVVSISQRVNVLTSPPITQEDLIQMTPKTVQFLLKESKGFYVVKRAWQPVFNMTKASSYGPIRFIDFDTTLSSISGFIGGIADTADSNYGFAICNLSSLPLACAPYVKAIRSWEVVPSRNSVFGPFTTTTSPKDDVSLVISKTVSDMDPFAYPHEYNGLGVLFGKVIRVVSNIPRMLRSGANIADKVASVCQNAQDIATTISESRKERRNAMRDGVLS